MEILNCETRLQPNLKKFASKQKQALRTTPMSTLESELRSKQKMKKLFILNIYQLNIYNALNLMFNVKNGSTSRCFSEQVLLNFT